MSSQPQDAMDAAQADQREELEQDIRDALRHAKKLGLPPQELKLLQWASGVTA